MRSETVFYTAPGHSGAHGGRCGVIRGALRGRGELRGPYDLPNVPSLKKARTGPLKLR